MLPRCRCRCRRRCYQQLLPVLLDGAVLAGAAAAGGPGGVQHAARQLCTIVLHGHIVQGMVDESLSLSL